MILRTSLLLLTLSTVCAWAEVTIRSGEHATFTRLVLTAPPDTEWALTRSDRRATIALSDARQGFDTSDIFARIPRTRLQDARDIGSGQLALNLTCDCTVDTFQLNSRVFVVDIRDPSDDDILSEDTLAEQLTPTPTGRPIIGRLALPVVLRNAAKEDVVPPLGFRGLTIPATSQTPGPKTVTDTPDVALARARLMQEIGQAAEKGMLDTSERFAMPEPATDVASPDALVEKNLPEEPVTPAPTPIVNLRANGDVDPALADVVTAVLGAQSGNECIPDAALDLSIWTNGDGFQRETGALHRRLYGEFDRIETAVAHDLAKLYIHFGFGAEALFVLNLSDPAEPEHAILNAMAETLEYGAARDSKAFTGQAECDTAAAFWAVMSDATLASQDAMNPAAVLRSFDALPQHLRSYLGPQLSARLRSAGHGEIAQDTMRIVNRGNRGNTSSADMEMSQLALMEGDTDTAERGLEGIVSDNTPPGPEALIELIDLRIASGEGLDADLATLSAAYAFEFRETELGIALQRAHVLALGDSGQFAAAVAGLEELTGDLLPEKEKATRSAVFDRLASDATDAVLLEIVLPHFVVSSPPIAKKTENALARRLLDLGVTEPSGALLAEGASGPDGRARQILRARLALLEERPRNAVAHLLGLNGEDVDLLRAEAFETLEEFDRAQRLYAAHGHEEKAQEMALLAQNWAYLQSEGDAVLRDAASLRSTEPLDDFGIPGIAKSMAALEDSQATQDRIETLLGGFQVDAVLALPSQ